jgi:hypothetical protein
MNCWEFKKCGKMDCPVQINDRGRECWLIAGTFCGGVVQGEFAQKLDNCMQCEFYKKVTTQKMMNMHRQMQAKARKATE